MTRDDWKYDEEMFEGSEDEEEAEVPKEKQCRICLHFIPAEAPYCPWCGKPYQDPQKPPR